MHAGHTHRKHSLQRINERGSRSLSGTASRMLAMRSCRVAVELDLDRGRGVAVMASNTSTALRYAQQDSAHSGHGPVWIWQRRFFAWKTRGWCGCGTLVLSSLGFEAWEGSEDRDEDDDEGEARAE